MLLRPRMEAEAAQIPQELEAQDVQVLAHQRGPSAEEASAELQASSHPTETEKHSILEAEETQVEPPQATSWMVKPEV